eukprot:TRINITY_DN8660_c0_g1_i1.p1 TRINITY_DN8660_c0_g1~~TRINITY_DN8660_c0_g1_i1.p1  ORF type:complete len:439 (+),score=70.30 TRINITY_DN8660_c0_g1_i1:106-1317(+)
MTIDGLQEFLRKYQPELVSSPVHILKPSSLSYDFCGRELSIQKVADLWKKIYNAQQRTEGTAQNGHPIPICSGIPGLGKTRMLEEWQVILKKMDLRSNCKGIIISYSQKECAELVDHPDLPIETTFSWKLLFMLYIRRTKSIDVKRWFQVLPSNFEKISLRLALETIVSIEKSSEDEPLVLCVGIDGFQNLAPPAITSPKRNLVVDLLNLFNTIITKCVPGLFLLPLFAGTDIGAIPVITSSNADTERVTMPLLTMSQIEMSVESIQYGRNILSLAPARRHLFYLGGVPRYFVDYTQRVIDDMKAMPEIKHDMEALHPRYLQQNFDFVWEKRVVGSLSSIEPENVLIMVATAIAGIPIQKHHLETEGHGLNYDIHLFACSMKIFKSFYLTRSSNTALNLVSRG